jgi:hypothetical protein
MVVQHFYGKEPHPLLWAGPRAARRKIAVSGISNRLNYYAICIVCTQFTNVVAGLIKQPGGTRVEDPCPNVIYSCISYLPDFWIVKKWLSSIVGNVYLYDSLHTQSLSRLLTHSLTHGVSCHFVFKISWSNSCAHSWSDMSYDIWSLVRVPALAQPQYVSNDQELKIQQNHQLVLRLYGLQLTLKPVTFNLDKHYKGFRCWMCSERNDVRKKGGLKLNSSV